MSSSMHPATPSRWIGRRYLFSIGSLRIPSYTVMLYLGCIAGEYAAVTMGRAEGLPEMRFTLVAILLLIPGLIGSRLWYVLRNSATFRAEPRRIWRLREGGASLDGGLILILAVSAPTLRLAGLPFWPFWDAASIGLLVGVIVARFGCVMHGCCAGRATDGPLGFWLPNHLGEWRRRFPTPMLEAGWSTIVLACALAARAYLPFPGALFACALGGYAAGRLVLATTREAAPTARTIPVNVAIAGALLAGAVTVLVVRWPTQG